MFDLRLCVKYCRLNQKTIKDSYRIPTIEEFIDMLSEAKWFVSVDLSMGYHQMKMEADVRSWRGAVVTKRRGGHTYNFNTPGLAGMMTSVADTPFEFSCGRTYHAPCVVQWSLHAGRNCPLRCEAILAGPSLVAEDERYAGLP